MNTSDKTNSDQNKSPCWLVSVWLTICWISMAFTCKAEMEMLVDQCIAFVVKLVDSWLVCGEVLRFSLAD